MEIFYGISIICVTSSDLEFCVMSMISIIGHKPQMHAFSTSQSSFFANRYFRMSLNQLTIFVSFFRFVFSCVCVLHLLLLLHFLLLILLYYNNNNNNTNKRNTLALTMDLCVHIRAN